MNRTLLDEPHEIQRDLDRWLNFYNLDRSHQGYRLKGRTPTQTLREALGIENLPPVVPDDDGDDPLEVKLDQAA
jgi:hypothetical protein